MTTITFRPLVEYPSPGWGDPIEGKYCGEIAPHLAGVVTLVVHRWWNRWHVSEIETGRRFGVPARKRSGALNGAREICRMWYPADAEHALMSGPDWVRES